jgi:hypothetical protein
LVAYHHGCLAYRESGQKSPEIVTVVQSGKFTPAGTVAKALKGTERHIFFVKRATAVAMQLCPGETGEPLEIASR